MVGRAAKSPAALQTPRAVTHTDDQDRVQVRRAYKLRVWPTARQAAALGACLEDHRQLYNGGLEHRRTVYRMAGITVRYTDQSVDLKHIRRDDPDGQGRWSFSSQQATLRSLDRAMVAFFRRVRAGGKPGYPRFKGAGWFDTVEWPKDGDGCRWDSQPHEASTRVYLQGVGHVKVNPPSARTRRGEDDQREAGGPPLVRGLVVRRGARPAAAGDRCGDRDRHGRGVVPHHQRG